MSIVSSLEDARFLWDSGRLEGAFVLALVAVAATARRVYPRPIPDNKAFEDFLNQGWFRRISIEFHGEMHPVYHIFYKWFRCELVHEGALPVDVKFVQDPEPGMLYIRAGGAPEYVLKISHGWFQELVNTVINAEVNRDLFPKRP